jgi:hypothetical protein
MSFNSASSMHEDQNSSKTDFNFFKADRHNYRANSSMHLDIHGEIPLPQPDIYLSPATLSHVPQTDTSCISFTVTKLYAFHGFFRHVNAFC